MFLKYAISRFKYEQNEMAYKIYISDSLYYQARNEAVNLRYIDLLKNRESIDNRTGDEIAVDVINAAGLRFKE